MPTIHADIAIDRPADDVWALLRDLEAVADWVPGVASARVDGTRRVCTTADGAEIHEELELDDERRRLSYSQPVHPLGFERSSGTLAVHGNGRGARVVWDAELAFADPAQEPQLLPLLEQGYGAALARLKARLEQSALDVVNRLYAATDAGEVAALVGPDMTFDGPLMHTRGAQEYVAMNEQLLPFHRGTTMLRQFENGDSVCSIYELALATPGGEELTLTMADWIEVADGRVASQRIYFDPREFARAFGM